MKTEHKVRIQVGVNYKKTVKDLEAVGLGVRSPNIRLNVESDLLRWIKRNFEEEGKLIQVGGWQHLSSRYEKYKSQHRPGAPILVWNGLLKNSFKKESSIRGRPVSGDTRIIIGTNVPYAKFHEHLGGRNRMPWRKMLPTKEIATDIAKRSVSMYIKTIVEANRHV